MKIYISTDSDSYGETSDINIEIVKNRIENIATALGHATEWDAPNRFPIAYAPPSDEEKLNERISLLAMECDYPEAGDSKKLIAAVKSAAETFPFAATDEDLKWISKHLASCPTSEIKTLIDDDVIIIGRHPHTCDKDTLPFARGYYASGQDTAWVGDETIIAPLHCAFDVEELRELQSAQDEPLDVLWVDYDRLRGWRNNLTGVSHTALTVEVPHPVTTPSQTQLTPHSSNQKR